MSSIEKLIHFLPSTMEVYSPLTKPVHNPNVDDDDDKSEGESANGEGQVDKDEKPEHHYFELAKPMNPNCLFQLYVCSRNQVLPHFLVRKARVEDCDDLAPMFRRSNVTFQLKVYFWSNFIFIALLDVVSRNE
jgi:hypothetical protein